MTTKVSSYDLEAASKTIIYIVKTIPVMRLSFSSNRSTIKTDSQMGEGGGVLLIPHKLSWNADLDKEWICHTDCNDDSSMSRLKVSEKQ